MIVDCHYCGSDAEYSELNEVLAVPQACRSCNGVQTIQLVLFHEALRSPKWGAVGKSVINQAAVRDMTEDYLDIQHDLTGAKYRVRMVVEDITESNGEGR